MNLFKVSKFFLYLVPLMIFIVTPSTLFPFIVGKYVFLRLAVGLAFIFFLLGLLFDKHGFIQIKTDLYGLIKKPLFVAVSVFIFVFLLACVFGFSPKMSFWSNFERGEGGLQLLTFYVFFGLLVILFKDEKDWQRIFIFMLIGGLGMTLYGTAAGLKYVDVQMGTRTAANGGTETFLTDQGGPFYQTFKWAIGPSFSDPGYRFQGSIGNPAYVAAYAIFMLFYVAYLLATKHKNRLLSFSSLVLWFLLVLFLAVFFTAATRGAFLGLISAVLVFIGYLAFCSRHWRKWLISAGVGLLLVVILLIQFKNASLIKSLPIGRLVDISFSTQTFKDRAIIWQSAIDGFKARPILGWGPESFLQIFDRHFNTEYFTPAAGFGAWFDRAHSIYFDYLAETGILGLLSFLAIWLVFYWQFFKKTRINTDEERIYTDKKSVSIRQNPYQSVLQSALLFALPIAYLVQGIVLFDVSPIYLNIFLFLAFAAYKLQNRPSGDLPAAKTKFKI